MALFFTSDWHIGEQQRPNTHSYLRPRPTEVMVEEWLAHCYERICPSDTLVFLGDVGITLEDLEVLKHLPDCHQRVLVLGDKEYASKYFTEADFIAHNERLGVFQTIVKEHIFHIGGRQYYASHTPTSCISKGAPALCGHVHGIWRATRMPNGHPIINVGIDVWGGLVSEAFIEHQYNAVTKHYDINAFPQDW